LIEIARLNGLRPWQQEKHYVQSLVLNSVSEMQLVFKGGTYLWFFHGLRRFSDDLDFTAFGSLPDDVPERVSDDLKLFGVENGLKKLSDDERSLSFRISAKGPLNTTVRDMCFVYVEISRRESVLEDRVALRFDRPEYQLPIKSLSGMALDEVGAEKIRTIMTRDKPRDVYDLYYLISKKGIKFRKGLVDKKLQYYKEAYSAEKLAQKIEKVESAYVRELKSLVFEELPDFERVSNIINKWTS
jgi:predicted nucleotidyltransferase component of viral defense system